MNCFYFSAFETDCKSTFFQPTAQTCVFGVTCFSVYLCRMLVRDIHTHRANAGIGSVRNLSLPEAEQLLQTDTDGLFSVGVHPWNAHEPIDWALLERLAADPRVFAVGECGLDKYAQAPLTLQTDVFLRQIRLARRLDKPVIVHCVRCFNELLALKRQFPDSPATGTSKDNLGFCFIVHGFRGKPQLAEQLLKQGFYLSFGEKFNAESLQKTPIGRRFRETDESDMTIDEIESLV